MAIGQGDFLEDGQVRALCTQCGAEKHEPFDRCENCAFQPRGDDLIMATAASVYRYFDQPTKANAYSYELAAYQGKDLTPLLDTVNDIEFDQLRWWLSEITQSPAPAAIIPRLVRTILPILLIAAVVGALLAYLKH